MPAMPSSEPTTPAAPQPWPAGLGLPVASVDDRQAGLPAPLREFRRRLLAHFAVHGGPPDPATVGGMAAELGRDPGEALGHLAAADLVHTDPATGRITVAYPFSGRPTAHRATLGGLLAPDAAVGRGEPQAAADALEGRR